MFTERATPEHNLLCWLLSPEHNVRCCRACLLLSTGMFRKHNPWTQKAASLQNVIGFHDLSSAPFHRLMSPAFVLVHCCVTPLSVCLWPLIVGFHKSFSSSFFLILSVVFTYCASVPLCPSFRSIFITRNPLYFRSILFLCFSRKVQLYQLSKGMMRNFTYPSYTSQRSVPIQKTIHVYVRL